MVYKFITLEILYNNYGRVTMLSKIFSYPLVRPYILYYNHSSAVQKDFKEDTETFSNLAESKWSPNYYVKLVNS